MYKRQGLDQTITLMQHIVPETKSDTSKIAQKLKRSSVMETCKTIWEFVYNHIQYRRDKTGIEQVRRPSRSWRDRQKGVDCDCYTVFISSILMNLGIPHRIRITKYNGRPNFQHVYPVVPTANGHITMDCVTDRFNHEVPYSDHRDYKMKDMKTTMEGLSGVDRMDLENEGLDALLQPRLPLRHTSDKGGCNLTINVNHQYPKRQIRKKGISRSKRFKGMPNRKKKIKHGMIVSPFRASSGPEFFKGKRGAKMKPERSGSGPIIKTLFVLGIGYATYKLFGSPKKNTKRKKKRPNKK